MVATRDEILAKVRIAREAWELGRKTMTPQPRVPQRQPNRSENK